MLGTGDNNEKRNSTSMVLWIWLLLDALSFFFLYLCCCNVDLMIENWEMMVRDLDKESRFLCVDEIPS